MLGLFYFAILFIQLGLRKVTVLAAGMETADKKWKHATDKNFTHSSLFRAVSAASRER